MKLTHARVTKYRCIEDSTEVPIEPDITALIGRNESGKTAFLEALRRLNAADGATFEVTADYPRSQLGAYQRRHARSPDTAISARFELELEDLHEVQRRFGRGILTDRSLRLRRDYKGQLFAELSVDEGAVIAQLVQKRTDLEDAARQAALGADSFQALLLALLPFVDKSRGAAVLSQVARQLEAIPLPQRIWNETLKPRLPTFISFGEDDVMPGAIALSRLTGLASVDDVPTGVPPTTFDGNARGDAAVSVAPLRPPPLKSATSWPRSVSGAPGRDLPFPPDPAVATVLALLDLAGVEPAELDPSKQSYEDLRARLEAAALSITEELVTYWSQDKDLEVTIDVAPAGARDVGFTLREPILRIRIGNRKKHASVPLGERSRGFAWFFSFLVRICQLAERTSPFIVLLDEPGLSLHAGMQGDFLRFIEERLGNNHQVIYTTHSPFMLDVARLERARVVKLYPSKGTVVSADLATIDALTLMPLRAALGASLVEGLLPTEESRTTLVVREASDLAWLRAMSTETSRRQKTSLDPRFEILPLGQAASLVPYALLTARPNRRLVLLAGDGLDPAQLGRLGASTVVEGVRVVAIASVLDLARADEGLTIEDLVDLPLWLSLVTEAHKLSPPLSEDELGQDGAIIARTVKGLEGSGETLDRLRVAEVIMRRAGSPLAPGTVDRFARLFEALNAQLQLP